VHLLPPHAQSGETVVGEAQGIQRETSSSKPIPRRTRLRRGGRCRVVSVRTSSRASWANERVQQDGCGSARLEDYLLLRRPRPQKGGSCKGRVGRRTRLHRRQRGRNGRWIPQGTSTRETILEFIHLGWNRVNVRRARLPSPRCSRHKQSR